MNPSAVPSPSMLPVHLGGENAVLENIFKSANFSEFLSILTFIISFLMAIVAITAIVILVINITRWAQAGGNPGARAEAQHNMLVCGICLGILGGFGTVYAIVMALMG